MADFAAPNSNSSIPASSSSKPSVCVGETTSQLHCSDDDNGYLHSQPSICKNAEGGASIAVAAPASPWRNSAAAPSSAPKNNTAIIASLPSDAKTIASNNPSSQPQRDDNNKDSSLDTLTDITNTTNTTTTTDNSSSSNNKNNHDSDDVSVCNLSNLHTDISPPCASTAIETSSSSNKRKRPADAITSDEEDDTVDDPRVLDPRGINYCQQNQAGMVDQDRGVVLACMRSVLDFASTKLKKKIVINGEEGRFIILPGTSLRHGNDPQVVKCLLVAIDSCFDAYDSQPYCHSIYNETNENANELYELMSGAAILLNINISVYDVETKDCLHVFCPSDAPMASLILTQYTDGDSIRIDLTTNPEYVDFDKVLWKLDTNPFPQNFNPEYDELLQAIFNDIASNRAGLSYKDHAHGLMRLVPLHLLNTRQGRERILGRFLPELLQWLHYLAEFDIHPLETPLECILIIDYASKKAIEEGKFGNTGGYVRASWMENGDRVEAFEHILGEMPPLDAGAKEAVDKLAGVAEGWLQENANKPPGTPSLLTYWGESLDILKRFKQENNSEVVDGAKANWASSQYFALYEMMISHAVNKFECLLLEVTGLVAFVGVAHLHNRFDFRALTSSFDGLNDVNGGGAHFAKHFGGGGIEAIVSWLRSNSRHFAGELVMSSTLVPNNVRWYAEFHQRSIERTYLYTTPLSALTVSMLQRFQCSRGGSAKRKSEDSTSSSTTTTTTTTATTTTLTQATKTSSPSIIAGLSEDILDNVRLRPLEEKLYKSDNGYTTVWSGQKNQVCRVEMKRVVENGVIKWEQCDKKSKGKSKDGCCKLHFSMFQSLDAGNDKKWKKEEKKCCVKGCGKVVEAREMCRSCYHRDYRKRNATKT